MNQNHVRNIMAGTRGGTLAKLLVFLVVFGCVVSAAWIYFMPVVLTGSLQKHSGFGVKVTQLTFNPFTARVDLTGLIVTNPESFPRRDFIEVTTFQANAKLATLFSDRPEFDYARVDVACVTLVRDADGVLNAELFNNRLNPPPPKEPEDKKKFSSTLEPVKDASATQGGPVAPKGGKNTELANKDASAKAGKPTGKDSKTPQGKDAKQAEVKPLEKPMRFLIRRLEMRLDKMVIADYMAATPNIREYNCKLFYAFNDVTDPKQLMAPFAFKSMQTVGAAIRGLIPGDIGRAMGAATQTAEPLVEAKDIPGADPLKSAVEKLEETQKP